jgi:hypothetical protein
MQICYDIFNNIISNRSTLLPTDITTIMLTCKRFHNWTTKHLTDSAAYTNGYPQRASLIATFTCYCGQSGWNIRYQCSCFVKCSYCERYVPQILIAPGLTYCLLNCETKCHICYKEIYKENISDFIFSGFHTICSIHKPHPFTYNWLLLETVLGPRKCTQPIPLNIIAQYDPTHPLLNIPLRAD